jgi:hypothetical protein
VPVVRAQEEGAGSGIAVISGVINSDHVVGDADQVVVIANTGRLGPATVVRATARNLRECSSRLRRGAYAETDGYLASLSDADLEQPLDLSHFGLGPQTVASTLTLLLLNHIGTETGEIACLKRLLESSAHRVRACARPLRVDSAAGSRRCWTWRGRCELRKPHPGA